MPSATLLQRRTLLYEVLPITGPNWQRASQLVNARVRGAGGTLLTATGAENEFLSLVRRKQGDALELKRQWGLTTLQSPAKGGRSGRVSQPTARAAGHSKPRGTKRSKAPDSSPPPKKARPEAEAASPPPSPEEAVAPATPSRSGGKLAVRADGRNALGETTCCVCLTNTHEQDIILCDACDREFHKQCCVPPLGMVPVGVWLCPDCLPTAGLLGPMCLGSGIGQGTPAWARSTASVGREW